MLTSTQSCTTLLPLDVKICLYTVFGRRVSHHMACMLRVSSKAHVYFTHMCSKVADAIVSPAMKRVSSEARAAELRSNDLQAELRHHQELAEEKDMETRRLQKVQVCTRNIVAVLIDLHDFCQLLHDLCQLNQHKTCISTQILKCQSPVQMQGVSVFAKELTECELFKFLHLHSSAQHNT